VWLVMSIGQKKTRDPVRVPRFFKTTKLGGEDLLRGEGPFKPPSPFFANLQGNQNPGSGLGFAGGVAGVVGAAGAPPSFSRMMNWTRRFLARLAAVTFGTRGFS